MFWAISEKPQKYKNAPPCRRGCSKASEREAPVERAEHGARRRFMLAPDALRRELHEWVAHDCRWLTFRDWIEARPPHHVLSGSLDARALQGPALLSPRLQRIAARQPALLLQNLNFQPRVQNVLFESKLANMCLVPKIIDAAYLHAAELAAVRKHVPDFGADGAASPNEALVFTHMYDSVRARTPCA